MVPSPDSWRVLPIQPTLTYCSCSNTLPPTLQLPSYPFHAVRSFTMKRRRRKNNHTESGPLCPIMRPKENEEDGETTCASRLPLLCWQSLWHTPLGAQLGTMLKCTIGVYRVHSKCTVGRGEFNTMLWVCLQCADGHLALSCFCAVLFVLTCPAQMWVWLGPEQ